MLRGELAIAALVLLTLVMRYDVVTGNGESFGVWLSVIGVSALLTIGATVAKSMFGTRKQK